MLPIIIISFSVAREKGHDHGDRYQINSLVRSVAPCTGAIASFHPDDLRLAAVLEKERSNFLLNLIVTITNTKKSC